MPEYNYEGRDASGNLTTGKSEATSPEALASKLFEEGIIPIRITAVDSAAEKQNIKFSLNMRFGKKVSTDDLLMFIRQIYTLIKSGIPIISSIQRLSEISTNPVMRDTLQGIAQKIAAGQPLSNAMEDYPKIFPNFVLQLIRVGEESGQLEKTLLEITDYLNLQSNTRRRVTGVLRYPMFVGIAIVIAVVIINIFVIPNFAKLYAGFKVQLPLPTRILIGVSNFMRAEWVYLLIGVIIIGIIFRSILKSKKGRLWWDKRILYMPIFGPIIQHILLQRFASIFAIILRAGIPIGEGIRLVADSMDNAYAQERVSTMAEAIEHGENLASSASATKLFSPVVLQMIAVGEETGSLDVMLTETADFYEREVDYELKGLGEKIEPIIVIAMAAMVLMLALGVFLPMWDMFKLAQHAQGGG